MSFEKINYQGLEQLADMVDDSTETVYYKHIYRSTFGYVNVPKKHMCFQYGDGHWCWKQAIERPDEALRYLFKTYFKKEKKGK